MWAGAAISVLLFIARLYMKSLVDSAIEKALEKRDNEFQVLKTDVGDTNKLFIDYAHKMFAQINSLKPSDKE